MESNINYENNNQSKEQKTTNDNNNIQLKSISDFEQNLLIFLNIDNLINLKNSNELFSEGLIECLKKYKNIESSIFGAYNFLDDPEKGILNNIKTKNCFFVKILNYIQLNELNSLEKLINKIKEELNSLINKISIEEIFISFILILYIYLQENVWGPSFTFIKETEKIDFEKDLNKFNNNYFNRLILNNLLKEEEIIKEISIFGEEPYKHSKFIILYYISYYFINKYQNENFEKKFPTLFYLWKIRNLKILNKLITEPIQNLNKEIENLYNLLNIDSLNLTDELKGYLYIEKSFYYLRYYHYKKCMESIEKAKNYLKLNISLTGKMGKKTKYQTFETPILVVDIKNQNTNNNNDNKEILYSNEMTLDSIRNDNPLLEKPILTNSEEEKLFSNQIITINDQIYITSLLNYLHKGLPDEDLNREIILSYSEKALKNSFDWLIFSKLLLHRSLAEDKSTKKKERSLLQIETLCNQFNDREPNPFERLKYFYIIDYPLIFNLKKIYAQSFMGFGAVLTALNIFKELFMYEDAIKCLYIANRKEEAKKLSNEVLNKNPDPGIYCILGELENNLEYFNKALEITNNKYTRAFRCLGRYYYINKDFNKSKEYYEKAMEINPIFPDIWFTLGIIYMSENNFIKGINSFGRILQMDDSNSEVWGNLGVCFIQVKKFKEAMKCFEEGYKRSHKNWKLLDNLVYVAIQCNDLNKILYALEQFYLINEGEKIKTGNFYFATKLYLENKKNYNEHDKNYLKNKIYNLFDQFSIVDGLKSEIWDLYALFIQENEINEKNSKEENIKIIKNIIELRLKEIRTLMVKNLNWEENEKIKDILSTIIKNMKSLLEKIDNDKQYVINKELTISNLEEKIKKSYEKKD